jgi:SAM-dependent methyltransferase
MPFSGKVRYQVADVMTAGYADESFAAVTAVSTIEHGMDVKRFVRDAARILKPNGMLSISTDYWPGKIDTEGIRAFSMPWLIFSAAEIRDLIQTAAQCGLILEGWDGEIPPARNAPVEWNGKWYTFIALVFRKSDQASLADTGSVSDGLLDPVLPSLGSLRSRVAAVTCE